MSQLLFLGNDIAVDLIKAKTIVLPSLIMPVARQCRETPIPLLILRRGNFVCPHFSADRETRIAMGQHLYHYPFYPLP